MGVEELEKRHLETYERVYLKEKLYDTPRFHYDWWLFPIGKGKHIISQSSMGKQFAVTDTDTQALLYNQNFMKRYIHCIQLYLNAQITRGWNRYIIRFEKLLWSLVHFIDACSNNNIVEYLPALWECAFVADKIAHHFKLHSQPTRSNSFHMFSEFVRNKKESGLAVFGPSYLEQEPQFSQEKYFRCVEFAQTRLVLLLHHLIKKEHYKSLSCTEQNIINRVCVSLQNHPFGEQISEICPQEIDASLYLPSSAT